MKLASVLLLVFLMAPMSPVMSGDLPIAPAVRPEMLRQQWQKAFAAGDSGALTAMYLPDADLLPPGGEKRTGASDIKKFWDEQTSKFAKPTLGTSKIIAVGPTFVIETGLLNFEHKVAAPTGPRKAFIGHYVVVWRKIGNSWKIAVDTWNSSEFALAPLP